MGKGECKRIELCAQWHRAVLRPDGRLIILEFSQWNHPTLWFRSRSVAILFVPAGGILPWVARQNIYCLTGDRDAYPSIWAPVLHIFPDRTGLITEVKPELRFSGLKKYGTLREL